MPNENNTVSPSTPDGGSLSVAGGWAPSIPSKFEYSDEQLIVRLRAIAEESEDEWMHAVCAQAAIRIQALALPNTTVSNPAPVGHESKP